MGVRVERKGAVGLLLLDRPEKAHAYDRAHLVALGAGLEALEGDVAVIVVGSTGDRAFCGGADLNAMKDATPLDALDLLSQRTFTRIARSPVITVAAVQGAAVAGGFELALACDLRIVGPNARMSLPETSLGIIPSAGGTTRLTRLAGPSISKQVILGGRVLDAEAAVHCGLAMEMADAPIERAVELAAQLAAQRDSEAQRMAKNIIDRSEDRSSLAAERSSEAILYARKTGK